MEYQRMKEHLQQKPFSPWLVDYNGRPLTQATVAKLIDGAVDQTFRSKLDRRALANLKLHSFRAAIPSELHRLGTQLTAAQRQMMGRWLSKSSYDRYVKSGPRDRFKVAQQVMQEIESSLL